MKKQTTILLSALILTGFCSPIIQTADTKAAIVRNVDDMVPSGKVLHFGEKFELSDLKEEASIPVKAYAQTGQFLENGYVKLNQRNIWDLQEKKETTVATPSIYTKSNWGGHLEYEALNINLKMTYDDNTKTFTLFDNGNPITEDIVYELYEGSARIHYVLKDTKKELYTYEQKEVLQYRDFPSEETFMIEPLRKIYDAPEPVGYFDAYNMDFEALANWNPFESEDDDDDVDFDSPIIEKYNRKEIDKDHGTEFTVYLEKAKPYTINFKVYLDNKPYFSKKVTGELHGSIPLQDEPKMPDSTVATLNKSKTAMSTINEYVPQLGTTIQTGSVLHSKIFDQNFGKIGAASTINGQPNFLNTGIYGISGESLEDNQVFVNDDNAGRTTTLELYYESNQADETPDTSVTADVTIESNLGKQVVKNVTGKVGEDITVTVPKKDGYVADKTTVIAHVDKDGKITTEEKVTYTKKNTNEEKPNNNNNQTNNPNGNNTDSNLPSHYNGLVGTMKKPVDLYDFNIGQMTKNKQRQLAANSDWKVDQIITLNGVKYYRVATNEWVKDSDVYRYVAQKGIVNTKDVEVTYLSNVEDKIVNNRGLAANTAWKYDRIAYLGANETKYYRVATNEFVKASDVINN
ncbi:hypothetical protein [Companilactobacillus futsaii]|uniref:Surface layer protein A domain-containing protein n=2 Tax=Companilactobacillus futsaii TaxID=938155 RepID=A0A5B7SZJ8_9LACO|nr:hypothetical protein [Companilactobacillus futsaii]KRK97282.1 hypothetical protein FC88_GL001868 [Companilactobacillus futsaii JCM 17355]QCX24863.1 hypothetical protein FG051_06950 [Companilactobacillus futsaii]